MVAIAFGAAVILLGLFHEGRWRLRLLHSSIVDGTVVGIHSDGDDGYFPEIEFTLDGCTRRFRSSYSIPPTPFIGTTVPIMVDAIGSSPEIYSTKTRWYWTLVPIAAGTALLIFGLAMP